jgi:hypothetical protein
MMMQNSPEAYNPMDMAANKNNGMPMPMPLYAPPAITSSETNHHNHQVVDPNETDALLVQELNGLSSHERESVISDIHGVAKEIEETPAFVNECLEKMEDEIGKITSKPEYEKAVFLAPHYVKSKDFRLLFLRADRFHPRNAARRIVNHFSEKAQLFGLEKLVKPIIQADLDEDDLISLKTGGFQLLAKKDRSGRSIIFMSPVYTGYKTVENHVRKRYSLGIHCKIMWLHLLLAHSRRVCFPSFSMCFVVAELVVFANDECTR